MSLVKIAALGMGVGVALAAGPASAAEDGGIEEVLVTAQKRAENIQKVGIAMQAYTADRLDQLGIKSSTAIAEFTPGVSISGSSGGQNLNVSIRGVTQNDYNDVVESPNAIYLDDGYLPFQGAQGFALLDIERVEVQKGPQGTLFGRNATGGLVQYISKKPSLTEYSGYISGETGVLDSPTNPLNYSVEGAVGGPISKKVAFRVAARWASQDPYEINSYPQGKTIGPFSGAGADLGTDRSLTLRGSFLFAPSDSFTSLLTGFSFNRRMSTAPFEMGSALAVLDANGTWVNTVDAGPNETRLSIAANGGDGGWDPTNVGVFSPGPPRALPGGDYFGYKQGPAWRISSAHAFDAPGHIYVSGVDWKNTWNVTDSLTVTSVTDYKRINKRDHTNASAAPTADIFPSIASEAWAVSQELRANGETHNFKWQTGVFYLHIDNDSSGALGLGLAGISVNSLARQTTDSYSVFGQGDWTFLDHWKLILGARYTLEQKDYHFQQALYALTDELSYPLRVGDNPNDFIANIGPNADGSAFVGRSSKPLWTGKVQLEYSPAEDILLYAGVNRGVKAGGFNAQLPGGIPTPINLTPYRAEVLWNYEGGIKSAWFDRRLQVNLSVFHYDYHDYQAFLFAGVGGIVINNNAKMNGGELSFEVKPLRGLDILGGVSYTHARVFNVPTDVTYTVLRSTVHPSYTPAWRTSLAVRYSHPFLGGTLSESASWTYRSSIFFSLRNYSAISDTGHSKFALGTDWTDASERWTLAFNIQNLTDERIRTTVFDVASVCGCVDISYELPRSFNLSLKYAF